MAMVLRYIEILTVSILHSQDSFSLTFHPRLWETSSGVVIAGVFASEACRELRTCLTFDFWWRRLCTVRPAAYEAFFGFFAANSFVVSEKGFSVRFLPCTGFGGIEGSYYTTMAECYRWPPRRGLETGLWLCHWENNSPMARTSTQPVAPRGSWHLSLHSVVQFPQYRMVKPLEKCFGMLHAGAWVLPSLELVDYRDQIISRTFSELAPPLGCR